MYTIVLSGSWLCGLYLFLGFPNTILLWTTACHSASPGASLSQLSPWDDYEVNIHSWSGSAGWWRYRIVMHKVRVSAKYFVTMKLFQYSRQSWLSASLHSSACLASQVLLHQQVSRCGDSETDLCLWSTPDWSMWSVSRVCSWGKW